MTSAKKGKLQIRDCIRGIIKGREGQFSLLLSCIFITAVTLVTVSVYDVTEVRASAGEYSSRIMQGQPWVVKSDGRPLAYVESEEAGKQVLLGLKMEYCDGLVSQQEAEPGNLVTVEKVPAGVYSRKEVLDTSAAVKKIVGMNKAAAGSKTSADSTEKADGNGIDTEPPLTIELNKVIEEDQPIEHKTKVIKTDKLARGKKEVRTEGEDGTKHVVSDVLMENGKYAGSKVLDTKVTEKAVTKVVYEGTKLSTSDKGELLVQYATRFLGTKYVLGGADERNGIDCSGFTMRMYGKLGIELPHYSYDQEHCGTEVKYEDAQPGDLILYPGHVGIYMGKNMMIHATPGEVKITDDCRYREITCVRRIFTDDDNVTQDMFDELFKEEYNEGAEELAKEKLSGLDYFTMKNMDEQTDDAGSGENE